MVYCHYYRDYEKSVASTALGVVSDKMRGVPLSEALKKRGLEANKKLLFNRKSAKKTVKRRTRPVNKRIRKSDVFGSIRNYLTSNHHNVSGAS